jgi:uncharacterized protein YecT (DUF1311 family)
MFHRNSQHPATLGTIEPSSTSDQVSELGEEVHPIDKMVAEAENEYGACNRTALVYAEAARLWEEEMNVSYQKLMGELAPELQDQLRNTQRTWIAFRDAESQFLVSLSANEHPDGTMWRSERAHGIMNLSKRRAEDLSVLEWSLHWCP